MPLYDYACQCGHECEQITGMDEMATCERCGRDMQRQLHGRFAINMGVGAYGYYDETLQTHVRTNRHKEQVMRERGVEPMGETPGKYKGVWT